MGRNTTSVGDFDGDGNQVLAVAVQDPSIIRVYFGGGAGTFTSNRVLPLASEAISVLAEDLNGDGLSDLIVVPFSGNEITLHLSDGAGGFTDGGTLPLPLGGLRDIAAADLNADGVLDLVISAGTNDALLVALGDAGPAVAFQAPAGDFSTLMRNPDGSFTRRLTDGTEILFDTEGRQTAVVDTNGNTTSYSYDPLTGNLISITDPVGLVTLFAYDAGGKLASITDPAGRVTTMSVNGEGDLSGFAHPDGTGRAYAYDDDGRMTAETDPRGFTTSNAYGFAGQLTGQALPDGASVSQSVFRDLGLPDFSLAGGDPSNPAAYSRPEDQLASFIDGNANISSFTMDEFGGVTSFTDALGRTTSLIRDQNGQPTRITRESDGELPDGTVPGFVVTELDYDERGNITAQREAVGTPLERQTLFEYEPTFNRLTRMVDPGGFETTFDYDGSGNLTKRTDALGGEQRSSYNAQGQVLTQSDENGNVTAFAYDASGNLETATSALGIEVRLGRAAAGDVTSRIEAVETSDERSFGFTYDATGLIRSIIDPLGGTTLFSLDDSGNLVASTDQTGVAITADYDSLERLIIIDDPGNGEYAFTYDGNGNPLTRIDPLGGVTAFEYDAGNRLTLRRDAFGNEHLVQYTKENLPASVQDSRGKVTLYAYDILGRLIRRTNPLGDEATFAHDLRDQLITRTDELGRQIDSTYDALGRLTGLTTSEDGIIYRYDPVGNLILAENGVSRLDLTHDTLNRVNSVTTIDKGHQPAVTTSYSYDLLGRKIGIEDTPGTRLSFGYDAFDRLTALETPAGELITLNYDAAGRPTGIVYPNSTSTVASFDATTGLRRQLKHEQANLNLRQFDYLYDGRGEIAEIVEPGRTRTIGSDTLGRLTSINGPSLLESYDYDSEGNRQVSHLSSLHLVDDANRLNEDDNHAYVYDLAGNLKTKTNKATGSVTSFDYDSFDRILKVTRPDGSMITYAYDALGRRIEKNVAGNIRRYVYDGIDLLMEFDGSNTLLARYAHGQALDQPLVMERDGASYFYHSDHLGSVVALSDGSGNLVNEYDYDGYGQRLQADETVENPFQFTAREHDAETGLVHLRARAYDPETGRFLTEDPLGFGAGDSNLYRYGLNRPLSLTDPFGLVATSERAASDSQSTRIAAPASNIGQRLACIFGATASVTQLLADNVGDPAFEEVRVSTRQCRALGVKRVRRGRVKKVCRTPGNFARGEAAENLVQEFLELNGFRLQRRVSFANGNGLRTVLDFAGSTSGQRFGIEVKSLNALLSGNQFKILPVLASSGCEARGENARRAGFRVGNNEGPLEIIHIRLGDFLLP